LTPSPQLCRQFDYDIYIDCRRIITDYEFVIWHSVNRDIAHRQLPDRTCNASSDFSDYNHYYHYHHHQPPRKPNRNHDINYLDLHHSKYHDWDHNQHHEHSGKQPD
jgi:hypothetical protein